MPPNFLKDLFKLTCAQSHQSASPYLCNHTRGSFCQTSSMRVVALIYIYIYILLNKIKNGNNAVLFSFCFALFSLAGAHGVSNREYEQMSGYKFSVMRFKL